MQAFVIELAKSQLISSLCSFKVVKLNDAALLVEARIQLA